ncbi:MAG: hypothetical protein A2270_10515 [Elusimicrobia bacterium RIFOXYA12_FULL_51_18]|nr:MAG: hypothetical protein A2270_10515 [Elusimicrobia bacterium RIFOXYA12_FULL_51_18]OGS29503.1 MAG: hypothetical protein A2218_00675 [Elusimicrobia bacterium RIFOXYA2_FULL_53_38]
MAVLASLLSQAVMDVAPTEYTSPALVSAMTGGEVPQGKVLPEWIEAATEEIDRRSGMCFRTKQFTNVLDGDGSDAIFLDCFPILEIDVLVLDGEVIQPKEYVLKKATGIIRLKDRLTPYGIANVIISGIHGYPKVPALVQKIATLIVAKTALSARFEPLVDSENIGDFSQTRTFKKLNDELDRAWEGLGKRFRIFTL